MCGFNIVVLPLSSQKRPHPQDPYAQPRSRKIRSKIGIGIPRSQSRMYPVAPASLILLVKRILDILSSSYRLGTLRVCRNLLRLMKTTIGTADECLMRHNPMPRDDSLRMREVTAMLKFDCLASRFLHNELQRRYGTELMGRAEVPCVSWSMNGVRRFAVRHEAEVVR